MARTSESSRRDPISARRRAVASYAEQLDQCTRVDRRRLLEHEFRAGLAQVRFRVRRRDADGEHSGRDGGADADRRILDHRAPRRRHAEPLGADQEHVRRRLATAHLRPVHRRAEEPRPSAPSET
jgi:hypothetical protein